jgi:ActR/RegA family two-component response regulator
MEWPLRTWNQITQAMVQRTMHTKCIHTSTRCSADNVTWMGVNEKCICKGEIYINGSAQQGELYINGSTLQSLLDRRTHIMYVLSK